MTDSGKKSKAWFKGFFSFEKGSVKMILFMVIPILLELVLSASFGMIDHMMAGQYSTDALNAIGLYSTPASIFNVAFTAINVGTTVRVAWSIGGKKFNSARQIMGVSIRLNFLISIIITAICMAVAPYAVSFMAGDAYGSVFVKGTVASDAVDVFRICSAGLVFQAITSSITSSLRGAGENRTPLVYNISSNLLNVIGNYIFIYGVDFLGIPEMGAQGAALSTSLCKFFACLFAVLYLCFSKKSHFGMKSADFKFDFGEDEATALETEKKRFKILPDRKISKDILSIGVPSAIESIILNFGFLLIGRSIASTGPVSYAAHQVTNSINSLFLTVGSAFSSAANTIIGQQVGAKDAKGIKYYVGAIMKLSFTISIFFAVIIWLFAGNFVKLYTTDESVVQSATVLLYLCGFMVIINNILAVYSGALRGTGDTKFPVYTVIFSVLFLRVTLVYAVVYIFKFGIFGVWCVTLIDQIVRGILMFIRYKGGRWKKKLDFS